MRNNYKDENIPLIGLKNLGNTCFMNAVLQIFNNISKFNEYLYFTNININYSPITKAFQEVIKNLRRTDIKSYSPYEFNNTIIKNNPKYLKNEPNDSRQLIQDILDSIHNELNVNKYKTYMLEDNSDYCNWAKKYKYEKDSFKYENKSIIIDLFYGIQATETLCNNCNKKGYVFEYFNILTLPIQSKNSKYINLNDMLDDYTAEKNLESNGKSKNFCLNCNNFYDAFSKIEFYDLPEILFIYPGRKKTGIKYDIRIDFKEQLEIKLSENKNNEIITYKLIGIIYHLGGVGYSGHNIAYCKRKDIWYEFNDNIVSKIYDIKDISGKGILLFIYEKIN